jgi:hypothetical protein
MDRASQLRERDVRRLSQDTHPGDFLRRYLLSNFPQTVAHASKSQKEGLIPMNQEDNTLKLMKKPLSGTKYDNPGGF